MDKNGKITAIRYGKATITAKSKENGKIKSTCTVSTKFYDVNNASKYYYKPVYWAADKGIFNECDGVYFAPGNKCSRADMVTFIWRYSGKPKASKSTSFKDVKYDKNSDQYKAIQWAVSKGLISADSNNNFRPNSAISRKDVLIMLYRHAGKPKMSGISPYVDVTKAKYGATGDAYKAIIWAYAVGIASGYKNKTFAPETACIRGDAITLLYKYKDRKSKNAYLGTPSSLKVESSDKALKISWNSVSGAQSYDIYRWQNGAKSYKKIATTKNTSWSYTKVSNGEKHTFTVLARSERLCSNHPVGVAGIYITIPKLTSASAVTTGIRVKWDKVPGASGYRVYRKVSGGWKSLGTTYENQFTDTSVSNNTKYTFTVRAYKDISGKRYYSSYEANGKTGLVKNKRGLTFSQNGKTYKYMEAYLGTTRQEVVEKISKHEKDNYYNGTPYIGGDHRNVAGDPKHTFSWNDVYGRKGVNCTGFVWRLLYDGGCNWRYIPNMVGSKNCWQNKKNPGRNTWYSFSKGDAGFTPVYYKYNSVKALLADGKAKKGDIIYMLQTGVPNSRGYTDSHVGIFWGNSSSENKMWHSGPTTEYGAVMKTSITKINACSPSVYYLFTWAN